MSFARILALTDLSENSAAGLELADALAHRFQGRVIVGYAHTRTDILRDFGRGREEARRLATWVREDDEAHVADLCEQHVDALRLQGKETVEAANAREGVAQLIQRVKPDLVCMATRGRTGVSHLLLGSIAEHTLRTAGVPVVVTKGSQPFPRAGEPLRVLVALDLIDDPGVLVRRIGSQLGTADEVILSHVVESWYYSPSAYGTEFALPQPDVPRLTEAAIERLKRVEPTGKDGPRFTIEVTSGRPGEGLLELEKSCHPHLVVAHTHGRRGFDRMMLGSVSEFLARRCESPVLIFPKSQAG